MSYNEPENYFNLAGFMSGKEVDKIFDILENALDRKGWHISKDAELSVRIYDPNLRENVDSDTSCEPSPFDAHPYYYEW